MPQRCLPVWTTLNAYELILRTFSDNISVLHFQTRFSNNFSVFLCVLYITHGAPTSASTRFDDGPLVSPLNTLSELHHSLHFCQWPGTRPQWPLKTTLQCSINPRDSDTTCIHTASTSHVFGRFVYSILQ
jgi:hypothetical protein